MIILIGVGDVDYDWLMMMTVLVTDGDCDDDSDDGDEDITQKSVEATQKGKNNTIYNVNKLFLRFLLFPPFFLIGIDELYMQV